MLRVSQDLEQRPLTGIALAALGYAFFSIQDAIVKWLVADYAVPQILFVRSVMIVVFAAILARREGHPPIWASPNKGSLTLRAGLILAAWFSYYSAARHLPLAELTTMYFGAPVMVVVLSIFVLKEQVGPARWLAALAGFAGVLVAANPTGAPDLKPAAMVLFAAFCWAWSVVLVRLVSRSETTLNQMLASSFLFALVCAATLPWLWRTPDAAGWGLMIALGIASAVGQYVLYEGFRYAPASAIAPIEYTGLVWAFLYGYLIWAEIPGIHVVLGAVLIVGSSLGLIWWERRQALRRRRRPVAGR
ncbi:DMT family transporter [Labrys wisconsinensis]|uniref:S-adenosylmethionine uptake transporter n=1 Tax=Labrys wisconsinensis TaxID=425677 RepID=A0ABU0J2K2_9HYPH|nr:DMT family transporter [Labrys wisconsinensis]MDQ0467668.1 S-adenosylmethionine uptake transporter [Labrys wisconsinensis]